MSALSKKMKTSVLLQVLSENLSNPELTIHEAYLMVKDSPMKDMPLLEFCQKLTSLPETSLQKVSTKTDRSDWPQGLTEEISYVLHQNDLGHKNTRMKDYITRMYDEWEVEVSEHALTAFCKTLNRKGWTK